MVIEAPRSPDRGLRPEGLTVSADFLWEDNHSAKADENRALFDEKTAKGELLALDGCSDSRLWTPGDVTVRNVAGALAPHPLVVSGKAIRVWNSASHFDGETVEEGVTPRGCGGLATKEALGNRRIETPGVQRYASESIPHKDPLIQAIRTAEAIAAMSGKPTLATAQDHLTLRVYPLAYFIFEEGEELSRSAVPRRYLNVDNYDPKIIYANGIPFLKPENVPDVFQELLERNRQQARDTLSRYPDLRDMQKVINPRIILLTTDIRSARVKYPTISSVPGSMFKIHLPREKVGTSVVVSRRNLESAIDQLNYPVPHSVTNQDDPAKPFHNTDTIIVETGHMPESRRIANRIARIGWGKNWLGLPGRRIVSVQANDGIVNDIEELKVA